MTTLAQLLAGKSKDDYVTQLKGSLPASFPVTTWREGDVPETLIQIDAQALSDLSQVIALIAMGGYITTQPGVTGASGDWLDLAAGFYGLTRNQAVQTQGTVTLTDSGGAGPFSISAGQLWVTDAANHRFTNTTAGTLSQNGSLALTFAAEQAGSAYNTTGALTLVTALPGVTLSTLSITQQGADVESDLAFSTRCLGMWAALGTGSPAAAYDLWARTASSEVTRTKVAADGTTAGQVNVYLAGASGAVSGTAVTAVTNYVTPRMPVGSTPNVVAATNSEVTVAGTVYVQSAYVTSATAAITNALNAFIQTIPIGGTVYLSAVIEQVMSPAGVRNASVTLNGGTADIALTAAQVATLTNSLTITGV